MALACIIALLHCVAVPQSCAVKFAR